MFLITGSVKEEGMCCSFSLVFFRPVAGQASDTKCRGQDTKTHVQH